MAKKSEGAEVRQAYDGPQVDADKLLDKHDKWYRAEQDSNSKAGERRQEIGALADEMTLEGKALSQFRAGMKIKNEGKQRDWLRSIKALIPIAEQAIMGNQPEMALSDATAEKSQAPVEPLSDEDVADLGATMDDDLDAPESNIKPVRFG